MPTIATSTDAEDRVLLDTNVLLRCVDAASPQQALAARAIASLIAQGLQPVVTPQNLIEFWVVATRPPERNGLGWESERAAFEIEALERLVSVLPDDPSTYFVWKDLVNRNRIVGVRAHDARLAASILARGVRRILTFNVSDFQRYAELIVLDPAKFAA